MDSANNDPISSAMGMNPLIQAVENAPLSPVEKNSEQLENDFQYARENIYQAIEQGQDAIKKLANLADQSQNYKAYEPLATLIKNVVDSSKVLLDAQKQVKELRGNAPAPSDGPRNITNNTLVLNGTTADLQKIIADMRNSNRGNDDNA